MAQRTARIVRDEDILNGEPRIEARRISVRRITEWVEDGDLAARTIADRHHLDVADVYAALAYYRSHPDERAAVDRKLREREQEARDRGAVSRRTLRDGD